MDWDIGLKLRNQGFIVKKSGAGGVTQHPEEGVLKYSNINLP
jgi:hypothetical protein